MKLTGAILAAFCLYVFSVEEPGIKKGIFTNSEMLTNMGTTKSLHWRPIGDHFFDKMVTIWKQIGDHP